MQTSGSLRRQDQSFFLFHDKEAHGNSAYGLLWIHQYRDKPFFAAKTMEIF